MNRITLYIGLNDKDTKVQKISTLECTKVVYNVLFSCGIDGATVYEATGIYKHDNGDVVFENTLRVELFGVDNKAVDKSIDLLKIALNQESIIKQIETVTSEFC